MTTLDLTKENFEATVSGSGIVLVDFWAQWCGPCRMFGPAFNELLDAVEALDMDDVRAEIAKQATQSANA